jgi:GntR family transcriptional regulator, carbon starvation induced regulator
MSEVTSETREPADPAAVPRLERVTGNLRGQIVSGQLAPGAKLRAEELAAGLGVSPTPVREAFQRLAGEGLITYSANRGVRVAPLTRSELLELYEIRARLEPWALERSMGNMDPEARTEIRRSLKELTRWYERGSLDRTDPGYEEAHGNFHRALIGRCDSEWLLRMVGMLSVAAMRYRNLGSGTSLEAARYEHQQLADLVLDGSTELATAALVAHLGGTQLRALEALTHAGSETPDLAPDISAA